MDMKPEVVVVPVSDVDRSKAFYESLGSRLDIDYAASEDFGVGRFTPPGSEGSINAAEIFLGRRAGVVVGQVTEHLRRGRVGEGRDVDQKERRRCGRVDSRAGAAR